MYKFDQFLSYLLITFNYDGDVKFIGNHLSYLRDEKLNDLLS